MGRPLGGVDRSHVWDAVVGLQEPASGALRGQRRAHCWAIQAMVPSAPAPLGENPDITARHIPRRR